MLVVKPASKDTIEETLALYGLQIIKAVPYDDCVRAYGPLFVDWYKENVATEAVAC